MVNVYLNYNQFTITFQTIFSKGIYFIKQQNSEPTYRIFIYIPEVAVGTDGSDPYADDAAEEGGGGPATRTRTRARLKTRPEG